MAQYNVLIDWNVTTHEVVEADSPEQAEELVEQQLDQGWRPDGSLVDLYDPQVVEGLTDLVEDEGW